MLKSRKKTDGTAMMAAGLLIRRRIVKKSYAAHAR
jgi:hypothetical protein